MFVDLSTLCLTIKVKCQSSFLSEHYEHFQFINLVPRSAVLLLLIIFTTLEAEDALFILNFTKQTVILINSN